MLMDESRKKSSKTKKKVQADLTKKSDSLPTLSNYDKSQLFVFEDIGFALSLWNLALKAWKFPTIAHAGFFVGSAGFDSAIYNLLQALFLNGYISFITVMILDVTLYAALILACLIFLAKIAIEGKKKLSALSKKNSTRGFPYLRRKMEKTILSKKEKAPNQGKKISK